MFAQRGVGLAHPAADAVAHRGAVEVGRDQQLHFALLALVALEEVVERHRVRHYGVDPPGHQVGIGVVLGVVGLDRDQVAEMLLHEVGVHGRGLHAYDLAFQRRIIGQRQLERRRFQRDHLGGRIVVVVGEVDRLLAFGGDRHRRPDHVDFVAVQRRDDAVPGGADHLAFQLLGGAHGVHQVDLEADPLAGRVLGGERRIRLGGGTELQHLVLRVGHGIEGGHGGEYRGGDDGPAKHGC